MLDTTTVTANADDSDICIGDSVTLSGGGAATYIWEDGVIDASPFTPALGISTYTVIGTDADGCQDTASIEITVYELPTVIASADDAEVCVGDMVTLSGEGAATYIWDGGVIDSSPLSPPLGITTYTVIGTDGIGCADTTTIDITVYESIYISYATTDEIFGFDGAINLTVTGGFPAYSYDWDIDGTGDYDDDEDLTEISGGTYIVVVIDEAGCTSTRTIVVESELLIDENGNPIVSVYPNPTINTVTIQLAEPFTFKIFNQKGEIVLNGSEKDGKTINLEEIATGIYYIKLKSKNVDSIVKLIKQ